MFSGFVADTYRTAERNRVIQIHMDKIWCKWVSFERYVSFHHIGLGGRCNYSEHELLTWFHFCTSRFKRYAVAQWLRHCATNRKVAGSISDGVTGSFHWYNPSGRTMALVSTRPLTEMSTRNISWGTGGRCVGLTILPPSCADCLKIWEPQPPGTPKDCQGL
jgi:hypothetical protein